MKELCRTYIHQVEDAILLKKKRFPTFVRVYLNVCLHYIISSDSVGKITVCTRKIFYQGRKNKYEYEFKKGGTILDTD